MRTDEDRTHGAESAINDDLPGEGMTAEEIRATSIAAGEEVRELTGALPDSPSKTEFLRIQAQLGEFWRNIATDEFCKQWLLVALRMQS